jgi:hypothetical protein
MAELEAIGPSPKDASLPYFAYGALKKDEIAWNQLADFVSSVESGILPGYKLGIVDGTAYALSHLLGRIQGDLISFLNPEEAYAKIALFEGLYDRRPRYEWTVVRIRDIEANMLKAKQPPQRYIEASAWSVGDDPVFSEGLKFIHKSLSSLAVRLKDGLFGYKNEVDYWEDFFQLQALDLFQWSFHERLESYRLGATKDDKPGSPNYIAFQRTMSDRRRELSQDPAFVEALSRADYDKNLAFRGYRHPHLPGATSELNPLEAWYRLRSNITHHAKGSEHELGKVLRATVDHFNTLLEFVRIISPRLAENYKDLTQIKLVR